jgi:FkbM family methyltransferase
MNNVSRVLKSLLPLLKPKSLRVLLKTLVVTNFDHPFVVSWSQAGEDLALLSIFGSAKDHQGTYLDIGAHHPSRFSVTRHLYQRGWQGVNVDANRALIAEFDKKRPRDINLCFAIGEKDRYEFTVFEETAISTINSEWRDACIADSWAVNRIETVDGRKLRDIYDQYFFDSAVDLLAIDAEGADFGVMKSMEFESLPGERYPKFLMLETAPPVTHALATPAVVLALSFGYEPHLVLPMATILKAPSR